MTLFLDSSLPTCPGCCSTDCAVDHRSIFSQMSRSTCVNQSDVSIISANQRRVLPIEYVRTCLGHQSLHVNYGLTILTLPRQLPHQMIHFTQTFLKSFRFFERDNWTVYPAGFYFVFRTMIIYRMAKVKSAESPQCNAILTS